jgi:hypothetical protein
MSVPPSTAAEPVWELPARSVSSSWRYLPLSPRRLRAGCVVARANLRHLTETYLDGSADLVIEITSPRERTP